MASAPSRRRKWQRDLFYAAVAVLLLLILISVGTDVADFFQEAGTIDREAGAAGGGGGGGQFPIKQLILQQLESIAPQWTASWKSSRVFSEGRSEDLGERGSPLTAGDFPSQQPRPDQQGVIEEPRTTSRGGLGVLGANAASVGSAAAAAASEVDMDKGRDRRYADNEEGWRSVAPEWRFGPDEKFLWYGAHSGFGNQVIQLKWALRFGALLNRTVILPPVLPHHSRVSSIGRCEGRPTLQAKIREEAWQVYTSQLTSPDYVSTGDILNVASFPNDVVRTIDLRHFAAMACRCDVSAACSGPVCARVVKNATTPPQQSAKMALECLQACAARMGANRQQQRPWETRHKLALVENTCGDTIYALGNYTGLRALINVVGPGEPSLIHRSAYDAFKKGRRHPRPVNLLREYGPSSPSASAQVLAFGSCFHPRIGDYHRDWPGRIKTIKEATRSLRFTPPIMELARAFIYTHIGEHFACMHVRGNDGYFTSNLRKTLKDAEEALEAILGRHKYEHRASKSVPALPLFLMTDLPTKRWEGTMLANLPKMGVRMLTATTIHKLVADTGKEVLAGEIGFSANRLQGEGDQGGGGNTKDGGVDSALAKFAAATAAFKKSGGWEKVKPPDDILLFVEQAICCHATRGTVTTQKSTASALVHDVRSGGHCILEPSKFGGAKI